MNISKYKIDYRDYLKSEFEKKKISNPKFSFMHFSKKIGVSKSYLKMLVDKKRHASVDKFLLIAEFFNIDNSLKQYFVFQILHKTAPSELSQNFFQSILNTLPVQRAFSQEKSNCNYSQHIFTNWLTLVIPDLLKLDDYEHHPKKIQEMLGGESIVSISDITSAIDHLTKNKLIYNKNGRWYDSKDIFFQDANAFDENSADRHLIGLDRSAIAIKNINHPAHAPCRFHIYSLGLSHKNANKLTEMYDQLLEKIESLALKKQKIERIMFVSNNTFSISKKRKS